MNRHGRVEPPGRYNQALQECLHPERWTPPTPQESYNLLVVGGGPAGLAAAQEAAAQGARVALVERHLLGGDSLVTGSVPSKTLLRAARALHDAQELNIFGGMLEGVARVDFSSVMERVRQVRSSLATQVCASRLRELGVDVFFGAGRFVGERAFGIAEHILRFSRAIIATGAHPTLPDIPGLEEVGYLTSDSLFSLQAQPGRLGVIGGGLMGCEMAQAFARLGTKVELLQRDPSLLPGIDSDAAVLIQRQLREEGIQIQLNVRPVWMARSGDGICIQYDSPVGSGQVIVDEVLLAGGRTPTIDDLGLDVAGVSCDPVTGVHVNDSLQTTNSAIYAAGDVCLRVKFAHTAEATARLATHNALWARRRKMSSLCLPWTIYTDPEIAHVGISQRDAEDEGIALETCIVPMADVDRAVCDGVAKGFLKIHTRKGADKILGATVVAARAGEVIGEVVMAMQAGIGLRAIADMVHPYPTQNAILQKAARTYVEQHKTRCPCIRFFHKLWLRWRR